MPLQSGYILGLDIAYRNSGISIVDFSGKIHYSNCISVNKKLTGAKALAYLWLSLFEIVSNYKIDLAVIEDYSLGSQHDLRRLAEAAGVAKACCGVNLIPCLAVPPTQIKLAVANHGHASKDEIAKWVNNFFKVETTKLDISDSLGIAYVGLLLLKKFPATRRGEVEILLKLAPEIVKLGFKL